MIVNALPNDASGFICSLFYATKFVYRFWALEGKGAKSVDDFSFRDV